MIRQAISCDICGAEKKQTNHWFVAWEQAGELRVSGWNSRNRLRTGSKHLCGQVCMHKLADDFMARVIAQKIASKAPADEMEFESGALAGEDTCAMGAHAPAAAGQFQAARIAVPAAFYAARGPSVPQPPTDTSLTSAAAGVEFESSARLLPAAPDARPEPRVPPALVSMRERLQAEGRPIPPLPAMPDETARFSTHTRRAEAWQRERERAQRGEARPEIVARRAAGNGA